MTKSKQIGDGGATDMHRIVFVGLSIMLMAGPAAANDLSAADSALMRGDYSAAVQILEALANTGDPNAMVHLASLYHRGEGVTRDTGKAVELYLAAAEQGHADAQFNLGNMYLLGEGLPQDEDWALTFYRLAAKQGHSLARRNMAELQRANGVESAREPLSSPSPSELAPTDSGSSASTAALDAVSPETETIADINEIRELEASESHDAAEVTNQSIDKAPNADAQSAEDQIDSSSPAPDEETPNLVDSLKDVPESVTPNVERAQDHLDPTTMASDQVEQRDSASAQIAQEASDWADSEVGPAAEAAISISTDAPGAVTADESAADKLVDLVPVDEPAPAPAAPLSADEAAAIKLAQQHGIQVELEDAPDATVADSAASTEPVMVLAESNKADFADVTVNNSAESVADREAARIAEFAERMAAVERTIALENYAQARTKLQTLVDEGHGDAALKLAEMTEGGLGAPADNATAMAWRRRAASLGNAEAQYDLAERHMHGRGVDSDEAMAITFYREAARGGHELAREKLQIIYADAGIAMPDFSRPRQPIEIYAPVKETGSSESDTDSPDPDRPLSKLSEEASDSTHHAAHPDAAIQTATPLAGESIQMLSVPDPHVDGPPKTGVAVAAHEPVVAIALDEVADSENTMPSTDSVAEATESLVQPPEPKTIEPAIIVTHPDASQPLNRVGLNDIEPPRPADHEVVPGSVLLQERRKAVLLSHVVANVSETESSDEVAVAQTGELEEMALRELVEGEPVTTLTAEEMSATSLDTRVAEQQTSGASTVTGDHAGLDVEQSAIAEEAIAPEAAMVATTAAAVTTTAAATEASGGLLKRIKGFFAGDPKHEPTSSIGIDVIDGTPVNVDAPTTGVAAPLSSVQDKPVSRDNFVTDVGAESSFDDDIPTLVESGAVTERDSRANRNYVVEDGKQALAKGDFALAAEIFSILAESGDAQAQAHLGYMYYKGEGVARDLGTAVDWYRRAAVQGDKDAQYNLAVAYAFGEGVGQDDSEAVTWYRRAAEQGSAIAQYSLGVSLALGEGIAQNDAEAVQWYRRAAEQGYAAAQYNLGYCYRSGQGITTDEMQALKWFSAAAANGHASAQYVLGYMYRSGRGVERNLDEAIRWYRLAAAQGHSDARADLASLNTDSY